MFADLHIHSYFSDGTMSPEEVALRAKEKNVSLASLCDHNTIAGYPRFEAACRKNGVGFIKGVEVSADFMGAEFHILGYGCDFGHEGFLDMLKISWDAKEDCSTNLIFAMSKDCPNISMAEYETYERKPQRGGWKGVDYLLSKNMGSSLDDIMKFYAKYGCLDAKLIHAKEVISIIHKAGGHAVLAHPVVKIRPENYESYLEELYSFGLDGIECFYPSQDKAATEFFLNFCRKRDMLITAGGDGHGDFLKYILGFEFDIGITKTSREALNIKGIREEV